ncbi:DUF4925 domain-containing protein [uncultured Bacteroides sp.]|uniref:DUF4925 domain-containing protein n=1 Tax=uncultured Bacteroides sp. TaxID=162156 RepID=UPI0023C2B933|nr:DUF4925 domain-containing protein [uncultured Bacteroides sp.]MDE6173175.1 DUF4925 domain-containing protein [Bacteroides sp.]
MKKSLFYLVALICSVSLFTSCKDDDEPSWKKLPSQEITAENLTLTTDVPGAADASVKLVMSDAQNGVMTLNNAVRGIETVDIDVTVSEQEDGSFKFQGEKIVATQIRAIADLISSMTVRVAGTISLAGQAEVTVNTIAAGNLVKKWNLVDTVTYDKDSPAHAPFLLQWVAPYKKNGNDNYAAENITNMGTNIISRIMIGLLKDVEFKANGSIVANYAKDAEIDVDELMGGLFGDGGSFPTADGVDWTTSPANLAYWYATENNINVLLNIPAIVTEALKDGDSTMSPEAILGIIDMVKGMSGADIKKLLGDFLSQMAGDGVLSKLDITKISDSDIEMLVSYVVNGFPLNYEMAEETLENGNKVNTFHVYLDKKLFDIFMPAIYPMLPDLNTLLQNTEIDFNGYPMPGSFIVQFLLGWSSLEDFEEAWGYTTSFNVGLDFATGSLRQ